MIVAKPESLFEDVDLPLNSEVQHLLSACGIKSLPPVHTSAIPIDRIQVPGKETVHLPPRFVRNIEMFGIRQPPSVVFVGGSAWDSPDATYEVVMGRRRVLAARQLLEAGNMEFQAMKCEIYEKNIPRLNAFLGLIENDQRSEDWIQDVIRLRRLRRDGIIMTIDDLIEYGFDRRTIQARLKISQLPDPILNQICGGAIKQAAAKQIIRLTQTQQERLETLVFSGEPLTEDLIKGILKRQLDQGLASLQTDLTNIWESMQSVPAVRASQQNNASLSQLLDLLHHLEPEFQTNPNLVDAYPVAQVLAIEVERALRKELTHV